MGSNLGRRRVETERGTRKRAARDRVELDVSAEDASISRIDLRTRKSMSCPRGQAPPSS